MGINEQKKTAHNSRGCAPLTLLAHQLLSGRRVLVCVCVCVFIVSLSANVAHPVLYLGKHWPLWHCIWAACKMRYVCPVFGPIVRLQSRTLPSRKTSTWDLVQVIHTLSHMPSNHHQATIPPTANTHLKRIQWMTKDVRFCAGARSRTPQPRTIDPGVCVCACVRLSSRVTGDLLSTSCQNIMMGIRIPKACTRRQRRMDTKTATAPVQRPPNHHHHHHHDIID